ncbi:5-bromo-4-chloroindolyl phosphate hydrolysis protein [Anaerotaenia torta]|uniref:5-bromo-4-chloroindolyl phosphate hydrolysis family protein n=1 Tax=Anaerotaenia torta TaxID=433293 RepID=UPI003D23B2DF
MKIRKSKSVVPVYLVGLLWIVYACLFPLYRMADFLIAGILSVLLYFIAAFAIPSFFVNKKYKNIDTGDSGTDEMLITAVDHLERMRLLRNTIVNNNIRKQIEAIENTSHQIIAYIKKYPDKGPKVSRFFSYYLPTTLNLINNYKELEMQEQAGDNRTMGMKKIEDFMNELVIAYRKVIDDLNEDKVMETIIDIEVMDEMLQMDRYIKKL